MSAVATGAPDAKSTLALNLISFVVSLMVKSPITL